MMPPVLTILKKKRAQRNAGIIFKHKEKKVDLLYRKGPPAYGIITKLQKTSGQFRKKTETFWRNRNAHTKYRQFP